MYAKAPFNIKNRFSISDLQTTIQTRCTQRKQNARLHVTSLTSSVNYCIIDHLLFVFEAMLEDIKMKQKLLINFQ